MTFFEFLLNLPIWQQTIIICFLFVWGIELFLLPFTINTIKNSQKNIENLIRNILGELKENKESHIDEQKVLSLLLGTINKRDKGNE